MRILLVEDDEILADRLVESLAQQQHVVDAIADGQEGLDYAQSATYDLIISDVGLPGIDGIALCNRLRQSGCSTPILLMTAKDAPDERIRGLDAGADDHLTKPLNLEEFQARVRALLRRGDVMPETVLQAGPLRLDPVSCQVHYGDTPLKLTPKEYSLLALFLRSPQRVFSRSHIIEHLWSFDDPPLEDSVKAHIKGLRRKLKQVGAGGWIENVYGIGYRFNPEVAAPGADAISSPPPEPKTGNGAAEIVTETVSDRSPTIEQNFQASMAGLWSKYQGLMSQRVEALTQAATAIAADSLTPELRTAATQAAHKLAGILGMFDRDDGSDLARGIETRLEADTPQDWKPIPALVQQLVDLIQLPPSQPPMAAEPSTEYWLLLSPDRALGEELQALGQAALVTWQVVAGIEAAEKLVDAALPELVVIDLTVATATASLERVQRWATHTPPIPTLVLTATDSLVDRVAIAQAGGQQLLTHPVTAAQVWDAAMQLHQHSRGLTAQILVVDDDPLILKALRPLLEPWGLGVTGLETPHRFWELLNATRPDLLVLDVEMPEFSGIELCQAVRTDPTWQNLPILFLTAHRDAETVQQVFRAGADDFVAKPIVGPELLTRILNRLERNRLLQNLSQREAITGLLNYAHSQQALTQQLEISPSASLSLGVIRLTDLPAINRQQGHDAGQVVLQTWGQCFRTCLQEGSITGYWGNGEFVVGLTKLGQEQAQAQLEPLLQALRRQIITLPAGDRLQPAFDWTVVSFPAHGDSLKALYQTAIAKLNNKD